MRLLDSVAITAAALGCASTAHAATFTFDISHAEFSNVGPTNGTLIDGDATDGYERIEYGSLFGSKPAALQFTDGTPVTGNLGDTFNIGQFIHENNPTYSSVDHATLTIKGDLTIDGLAYEDLSFSYQVAVDNTPNRASDCPDEPVPCDDVITISTLDTSDTVNYLGNDVTLNIVGFFLDGEMTDQFATLERATSTAFVRATISALPYTSEVPIPAAGWMMAGAAGLLWSRSRKRRFGNVLPI